MRNMRDIINLLEFAHPEGGEDFGGTRRDKIIRLVKAYYDEIGESKWNQYVQQYLDQYVESGDVETLITKLRHYHEITLSYSGRWDQYRCLGVGATQGDDQPAGRDRNSCVVEQRSEEIDQGRCPQPGPRQPWPDGTPALGVVGPRPPGAHQRRKEQRRK